MARYLTEKLRVPVFILSDFQTANSYKVVAKFPLAQMKNVDDIPDFVFDRFHMKRLTEPIQMVRTQQTSPGTEGGMRRITGLNTDENGKISYFSDNHQRSHAVRNEKIHHVRRALTAPEMFGKDTNEVLIVGWGSTRGAIEEAIYYVRKEWCAGFRHEFSCGVSFAVDA